MGLHERLLERAERREPVTVGVVGAGQMGTGLIVQLAGLAWCDIVGVADVRPERCLAALESAGVRADQVTVTDDPVAAKRAREAGRCLVTKDAELLANLEAEEVVVDATGVPEVGARVAHAAISARKHVVMLNVEADITVGHTLKRLADQAGVVYTGSAGDEYAATKELVDFANVLGFWIIAAGKGKNNPLDRNATPDQLDERAKKVGANPWMLCSFVDGTKTAVEMTCLSNATGLVSDVRGMHGPHASLPELPKIFCPREDGGILQQRGVVDYALGVAPGVFVIVEARHPLIARELEYLQLGNGPYWALFRPYHLANLETAMSIARAVVYGEATIAPLPQPVSETIAIAKRDLRPGEVLDAIGGYTFYGVIERHAVAAQSGLLPLGLAEGVTLHHAVRKGEPIPRTAVDINRTSMLARLRDQQEAAWVAAAAAS
jgi:predicted homoserine dehydrogenase-like protein